MQIPDDLKAVLIAIGIIAVLLIVLVASKDSGPKYKIKEVKEPVVTKPAPKKAPVKPPKPQWIACPKCNGTGYQKCWRCNGKGTYCKACEGKGEHYILDIPGYPGSSAIVKCGRCNGTGNAGDRCPTCNGTGRSPYDKCWRCKGTGKIRR